MKIEINETSEQRVFRLLTEALNSDRFELTTFAACIPTAHPTLPQRLFKLMQTSMLFMAQSGNMPLDNRNRASYTLCREVEEVLRRIYLPRI